MNEPLLPIQDSCSYSTTRPPGTGNEIPRRDDPAGAEVMNVDRITQFPISNPSLKSTVKT